MPPIRPIQPSFSSGEVSPQIYPRVDLSRYQTSLKKCRNFIVAPQGSVYNRPGTRFVHRSKYYDTKESIVQEFIFNREQRYILEIGDLYIRFYTSGAIIEVDPTETDAWSIATNYVPNDYVIDNSIVYRCILANIAQQPPNATYWVAQTIYEIDSPYLEADLQDLRFESSADTIFITHPDYQTRVLQRFGEVDWRMSLYEPEDGPFMVENTSATTITASAVTGAITLTASSSLFNVLHIGALFKTRHYVEGQTISSALISTGATSSIKCFTTWRIITHGTWTARFNVEKSSDGGSTWTVLRTFSSVNDFNANTSGTEDIETNTVPFKVRVNVVAYTSGTINVDLTTDPFFQEGIAQITTFTSDTIVGATVLTEIASTAATASWFEGSWSDYRGWPSVARFFQDRLTFANTATEPMTIWMTETSNYFSFVRHSLLLDTDGITVNLPSRQLNAINGLVVLTNLIVLTSASEWSVGPTDGAILTPTSVRVQIQGYRGSSGVNPVVIGNEAIYVQSNGKVIRNIGFELSSDSFTGSDLNILARHLFEKWDIIDIAYQQDPDSIVWCLRSDGYLLGMTYMREQEVVAWHWHDSIDEDEKNDFGEVESIAVVPSNGFDELWMVVNRANGRFIERMVLRMEATDGCGGIREVRLEDQVFVDSAVLYNPTEINITNITNTNPIVVTAPAHGLSNGDIIRIDGVIGMTELNGNVYQVGSITTDTFELFEV